MHFDTATNYFFAMEEDASELMLELTHNHDRTEPYDKGDGYRVELVERSTIKVGDRIQ